MHHAYKGAYLCTVLEDKDSAVPFCLAHVPPMCALPCRHIDAVTAFSLFVVIASFVLGCDKEETVHFGKLFSVAHPADVLAQVQTKTFARGFIARAKRGILLKALRNQATKLMYGTKPVSSVVSKARCSMRAKSCAVSCACADSIALTWPSHVLASVSSVNIHACCQSGLLNVTSMWRRDKQVSSVT